MPTTGELMIIEFISNKLEELKNDPSSLLYRITAAVLASIIFSAYPIYIFVIYMWEHKFYSYDVIGEAFSLGVFFYANLILLVVVSFFLLGSVTTSLMTWKHELSKGTPKRAASKKALLSNVGFIAVNLLTTTLLIASAISSDEIGVHLFVAFTSVTMIFLITSLAVGTAKFYFKALIIVAGLMYCIPLAAPNKAAILLADGLKFFGAGNQKVNLDSTDKGAPFHISGELTFLSPEHIYLKNDDELLIIIPRRDTLTITYKKVSKKMTTAQNINDILPSAQLTTGHYPVHNNFT